MAYVHFEQLIPALHSVTIHLALPLPCRPSPPQRLMVYPSFAILGLALDFNTVTGVWLGRLEATLAADQLGGTHVRFLSMEGRPSRLALPPLMLHLPPDPRTSGPSPSASLAFTDDDAITDPTQVRAHLDRIAGASECMADFALFDGSPGGRSSLLVGRSGCEVWQLEGARYEVPFLAPGGNYAERNKLSLQGGPGGAPIVALAMSEVAWAQFVRDIEGRWGARGGESGSMIMDVGMQVESEEGASVVGPSALPDHDDQWPGGLWAGLARSAAGPEAVPEEAMGRLNLT